MPESFVFENTVAMGPAARTYFAAKLSVETDAWDVYHDLKNGVTGFVLVDPRSPESYAKGHIPGAVNSSHHALDRSIAEKLPEARLYIVYCSGPGCNAAAKAAVKLASYGIAVREMIGGLEWWQKSGYPVHAGADPGSFS